MCLICSADNDWTLEVGNYESVHSPRGKTHALQTSTHSNIELPGMPPLAFVCHRSLGFIQSQPFIDCQLKCLSIDSIETNDKIALNLEYLTNSVLIWQLCDIYFQFNVVLKVCLIPDVNNLRFIFGYELILSMTSRDDFISLTALECKYIYVMTNS